MFGEDHPAIISYNGNLVTCYSNTKEKAKQEERSELIKQIIDKNWKIA
jgi:transglutaminase/protease-like cytokinesis protein 3